jgi:hypothetical protein
VSGGADVGAGAGSVVVSVVDSLADSVVGAWGISALDSVAHAAIAPVAISTVKIRRTPRG